MRKKMITKAVSSKQVRFLIVGCINTFAGYGVYALMIFCGFHYVVAQTVSLIVGVANSYLWNKYFTFRQPRRSLMELVRFVSVYAASYLMSLLILFLCVDVWGISAYLAGAVGLFFTTIISYFGHNYFSFGFGGRKKP
jgi:putative flippase GtrA